MSVLTRVALKAELDSFVHANGNKEITANQMNQILTDFIDSFFNVVDNLGSVGLSEFDPAKTYPGGTCCVTHGIIYQANVLVSPGSFNSAQWTPILFGTGVLYSLATRKEALAIDGIGFGVNDQYTLPAGKLARDGDKLILTAVCGVVGGDTSVPAFIFDFGAVAGVASPSFPGIKQNQLVKAIYEIVRESSNIIRVNSLFCCNYDPTAVTNVFNLNMSQVVGGVNIETTDYIMKIHFQDWGGGTRTGMSIEEHNIVLMKKAD